jgi:hypothetical protein
MERYKNEPLNTPEQKIIELVLAHKNALQELAQAYVTINDLVDFIVSIGAQANNTDIEISRMTWAIKDIVKKARDNEKNTK